MTQEKKVDLAVIGAGPVGVEAALYAQRLGMKVRVLEREKAGARAMSICARAAMFTPWHYCYSPLGIDLLRQHGRFSSPDEPKQWRNYFDDYLEPVLSLSGLDIRYGLDVTGIGRSGITRSDLIGANRQSFPFRLLLRGPEGLEDVLQAERVIDASGVRNHPLFIGEGRLPAINERALHERILFGSCGLAERVHGNIGKTWLLIGDDYETAAALLQIRGFLEESPQARLIFIAESGRKPFIRHLKNDLFTERVRLKQQANDFLEAGHERLLVYTETVIRRLDRDGDGLRVGLHGPHGELNVHVDHIVGCTGLTAAENLWSELEIHQCYASGAPMATSAAMLEDAMDFRHTPYALGADSLKNPEPGFYVLGSKSYGRNRGFTIHIGLGQIVAAFRDICNDPSLDLYAGVANSPIPAGVCYLKPEVAAAPLAEEQLSDSEQKYKTIADNLQEVVFQTDLKQLITYLSPSWRALTGKDPADSVGLHWQTLLSGKSVDQGLSACNAFMSSATANYHEELTVEHSDGSQRWVEVYAHLMRDLNGMAYGTIGSMVDITERVNMLAQLEQKNRLLDELALTDPLTGLFNRRHFDRELSREIRRALREAVPLTLAMIDIDHFKFYNDTYGHQLGDMALKLVSQRIRETCKRATDLVARYGGEEFVVLLPGSDRNAASQILEGMRKGVESLKIEHRTSPVADHLTLSIGAATIENFARPPAVSPEIFIKRADDALYESKRQGRNRLIFCVHEGDRSAEQGRQ